MCPVTDGLCCELYCDKQEQERGFLHSDCGGITRGLSRKKPVSDPHWLIVCRFLFRTEVTAGNILIRYVTMLCFLWSGLGANRTSLLAHLENVAGFGGGTPGPLQQAGGSHESEVR